MVASWHENVPIDSIVHFTIKGGPIVARGPRTRRKAAPVSVAVTPELRRELTAEARRRGLGISTTLRTLAIERANEIRDARQRERARRWQSDRMRALVRQIEAGELGEANPEEIDALFDRAAAKEPRASASR